MLQNSGFGSVRKFFLGWVVIFALLASLPVLAQQQTNNVSPSGSSATDMQNINTAISNAITWETTHAATAYVLLGPGTFYLNDGTNGASCNPNNSPAGAYCINITAPDISGTPQPYLVFEGSVDSSGNPTTHIEMIDPNAGIINLQMSSYTKIVNLILDYQTPPFIQGTVQDVHLDDPTHPYIDVTVDSGYQNFADSLYQCSDSPQINTACPGVTRQSTCINTTYFLSLIQPASGNNPPRIKPNTPNFMRLCPVDDANGSICAAPSTTSTESYTFATKNADGSWRLYYNTSRNPGWRISQVPNPYIAAGDRFVFIARSPGGNQDINVRDSNTVSVKNVTVHAAPDIVANFVDNTGALNVNGLHIATSGTRLISSNAGGTIFTNDRGPIAVFNSSFQGIADDAYSSFSQKMNIEPGTNVTTGSGGQITACLSHPLFLGDQLQIVDNSQSSTNGTIRGMGTITALSSSTCSHEPSPGGAPCTITMDNVPVGTSAGTGSSDSDIVYLYNGAGGTISPSANVHNNTFGSHRQHGILMNSPNSEVFSNQFTDLNLGGIMVGPWSTTGAEGPVPDNVAIHDNSFTGGDILDGQLLPDGSGGYEWCNWNSTTQCNALSEQYYAQIYVSATTGYHGATAPAADGPSNVNIHNNTFTNPTIPSVSVGVGEGVTITQNTVASGSTVYRVPGPSILLSSSDPGQGTTLTVPNFTLTSAGPDTNAAVEIGCGVQPVPNYTSWTINSSPVPAVLVDSPCP